MEDVEFWDKTKFDKNIRVNFTGKDYLDYVKYEDNKRRNLSRRFVKAFYNFINHTMFLWFALIVYLLGRGLINTIYPSLAIPKQYGYFLLFGLTFPYIILYILIIFIAISFIIHGFGFVIIKR